MSLQGHQLWHQLPSVAMATPIRLATSWMGFPSMDHTAVGALYRVSPPLPLPGPTRPAFGVYRGQRDTSFHDKVAEENRWGPHTHAHMCTGKLAARTHMPSDTHRRRGRGRRRRRQRTWTSAGATSTAAGWPATTTTRRARRRT